METLHLNWSQLEDAAKILREGGVVAFPTETVYGLGAIASKKEAFERLVELKKRPPEKPFTLMCSSIGEAVRYAEIDHRSRAVLQKFLPGEVTLLLSPRPHLPAWITLNSKYIGIRIPELEEVRNLIALVGEPLLVPSANISGEKTATNSDEVSKSFEGRIDAIIEGECKDNLASTIVICGKGEISLVREGPVPFEEIKKVYQEASCAVSLASDHGGFVYKEAIKKHLLDRGFHVLDEGTHDTKSCDYPDFAFLAAKDVAEGRSERGILVCTSGEGIMMAANKVPSIRCGVGYDDVVTAKCVEHNDANMISFGEAYMSLEDVLRRVDIFLAEKPSSSPRHQRRVGKINAIK